MKAAQYHDWQVSIAEAKEIQKELAIKLSFKNEVGAPRLVAGIDTSKLISSAVGRAAVVVASYPQLTSTEIQISEGPVPFPYVPGYLSFREAPLVLEACRKLSSDPDLLLVDGQGFAHPRRFGLASHLGLLLDVPTIGCAKSRLCGQHDPVGEEAGSYSYLVDRDEVVGAAVRTRAGSKPLYISVGHKIDLPSAIKWVLSCCNGYRLPEPTRLAHLASTGKLTV